MKIPKESLNGVMNSIFKNNNNMNMNKNEECLQDKDKKQINLKPF